VWVANEFQNAALPRQRFEFHSFSFELCVAGRFGRRLLPAGVDLLLCEFQIVLSKSPVGL
jgi:hypothetical protein